MTTYDMDKLLHYAKVARLAPVDIKTSDADAEKFLSFFKQKDFNDVFNLIEKDLQANVKDMKTDLIYFKNQETKFREDTTYLRNNKKDILQNSCHSNEDYYVVPKVIE